MVNKMNQNQGCKRKPKHKRRPHIKKYTQPEKLIWMMRSFKTEKKSCIDVADSRNQKKKKETPIAPSIHPNYQLSKTLIRMF